MNQILVYIIIGAVMFFIGRYMEEIGEFFKMIKEKGKK